MEREWAWVSGSILIDGKSLSTRVYWGGGLGSFNTYVTYFFVTLLSYENNHFPSSYMYYYAMTFDKLEVAKLRTSLIFGL